MTARFDDIVSRLIDVRRHGDDVQARCPAHKDDSPSLALTESNGRILMYCFAGCRTENVCESMGLKLTDLFSDDHHSRISPDQWKLERDVYFHRIRQYGEDLLTTADKLRRKDFLRMEIERNPKISLDEKMDQLAAVYDGYSDLELEFEELLSIAMPYLPKALDPKVQRGINALCDDIREGRI